MQGFPEFAKLYGLANRSYEVKEFTVLPEAAKILHAIRQNILNLDLTDFV